jgi:hypothetical protein
MTEFVLEMAPAVWVSALPAPVTASVTPLVPVTACPIDRASLEETESVVPAPRAPAVVVVPVLATLTAPLEALATRFTLPVFDRKTPFAVVAAA